MQMDEIELLKRFVKTDTSHPEGNEKRMTDILCGLWPDTAEKTLIRHSDSRYSLIVRIKGRQKTPGTAFLAHIDTVAFGDRDLWTRDPLSAEIVGNELWGRGSVDMKGGCAAITAAGIELLGQGFVPEHDMLFCYTADEEEYGTGIRSMVSGGYLDGISRVIVCEPSGLKTGCCEKGCIWISLRVTGCQSHASRPEQGLNAAEGAIRIISEFKAGMDTSSLDSLLGRNTCSLTVFKSGVGSNIVPPSAEAVVDIRTIPGTSNEKLIEAFRECCRKLCSEDPRWKAEAEVINDRAAAGMDPDGEFTKSIMETARSEGIETRPAGIYFYTDISQVVGKLDVDFCIIGPGDELMCHKTDERIDVDQVKKAKKLYLALIKKLQ
ncbi:MAG: M20 family metallopeptidase [Oscillospiraceae bacterium]|jgi:succinyl-diaminopimelate desuccinylase